MRHTRFISILFFLLLLCDSASPMAAGRDNKTGERPARLTAAALRRGEELRAKWNLNSAEAAFREAATLEPSLEASLGLARIARARLEYADAIRLLDKASREQPNSAEVLGEYGSLYLAAEEPKRARGYFERALHASPSDAASIIGLAGVDLLERDYVHATQSLREYLARDPQNARGHAMLARALLESNKISEAGDEAARAVTLDAYNVEALYTLACVRSSQRKADEARSLARRVVALDPFNVGARRVLSQYLDGQAGYQQRVSAQAREHYWSGRALKQQGELGKAVTEFEAALRVEPHYYEALIGLADVWLRRGECERAAVVAKLATEVDPDGALAHLELSCAYRGINELARIEIGAVDFAALFYTQPAPPAYALTRDIFPNYGSLTKRQQSVIDGAVAPLAGFLPKLAHKKARHYLLSFDQRPVDLSGVVDVTDQKTFDGRYYASLRGVGGRVTVSGIEYLDQAARGGFNTIAHEFAHQVHIAAMGRKEVKEIRKLYERARNERRTLDYYAATNEYEYFAQGYEAFISDRKRPSAGVTGRHTTHELLAVDPELYNFLVKLSGKLPARKRPETLRVSGNIGCLTTNNPACKYAGGAFPVGGGQQRRLLRTHPRVALNSAK
jgi:tetratricopeptide (TPR) repeat protein